MLTNESASACLVGTSGTGIKSITVGAGRAFINGYQAILDGADTFVASTLANGYYRVILRLDLNVDVRAFSLLLVQGTTSAYPALVRTGNIYDLCLANVVINTGVPTVTDTRSDTSLCGIAVIRGMDDIQNQLTTGLASIGKRNLIVTFKESGTFRPADYGVLGKELLVFLVGGGQNGKAGGSGYFYDAGTYRGGSGGDGGSGGAVLEVRVIANQDSNAINVGAAGLTGGNTSAFGYTAPGGGTTARSSFNATFGSAGAGGAAINKADGLAGGSATGASNFPISAIGPDGIQYARNGGGGGAGTLYNNATTTSGGSGSDGGASGGNGHYYTGATKGVNGTQYGDGGGGGGGGGVSATNGYGNSGAAGGSGYPGVVMIYA